MGVAVGDRAEAGFRTIGEVHCDENALCPQLEFPFGGTLNDSSSNLIQPLG